ncbi:hypothetical protein [Methylosinus sp. LW3]|uniref:hypothetical protein n=1 Tax=Methylosinus sp. LW3 TaxID=107635 RepID=UPI001FDA7F25|nr:hypothetical protein [Methylosinus sp. LW3]
MEIAVVENARENVFRQNVLNQHLAHVIGRDDRIDRVAGVVEEFLFRFGEGLVAFARLLDFLAQRRQHGGQVGLELLDRLAELRDFRPLIAEEQIEQAFEPTRVVIGDARDFLLVLNQDRATRILENDIVLRIALALLLVDFLVEVVVFVLGFPIAERHAKGVEQGAIDVSAFPRGRLELELGDEDEIILLGPGLEQILEGLAHDAFAFGAGNGAETVQLGEELVNEKLTQGRDPLDLQQGPR